MERQINFTVKGNSYMIEFPTVGKFQQIETMKQISSRGMYSSFISTSTLSSNEALTMIDVEAYLTVLAPKLLKDLKCDSFNELGIEDYLELKKAFQEQFIPWWNAILDLISPKMED